MIRSQGLFRSRLGSLSLSLLGSLALFGCASSNLLDPIPLSVEFPVDYQGHLARGDESRIPFDSDVSFQERGPGGFEISVKIVGFDDEPGTGHGSCLAGSASSEVVSSWLKTQLTEGRARLLAAPELRTFDEQSGRVQVSNQVSYIRDFELEKGKDSFIANPIIGVADEGMILEVTPRRSENGAPPTFRVHLMISDLERPLPEHEVKLPGIDYEVTIQVHISLNQDFVTNCALEEGQTLVLGPISQGDRERQLIILLEGKWVDDLVGL